MFKVSIIIPTYNHELYIADCLTSILNQSFTNWEAIIVDDGSTDSTAQIISEFVNIDSRFKYYFQENKGLYRLDELYNFALSKAKGDLVAILEGDDYWPQDKLTIQTKEFKDSKVGLVWGNGKLDVDGILVDFPGITKNFNDKFLNNKPVGSSVETFIFNSSFFKMPSCSVMFRTSSLREVGGFYQPKGLRWLDRTTWALIACIAEFRYIPENLGVWRRHAAQATQNNYDIRCTFDLVFEDKNCPKILLDKIIPHKETFLILSDFSKLVRTRNLKYSVRFMKNCFLNPLIAFRLLKKIFFS